MATRASASLPLPAGGVGTPVMGYVTESVTFTWQCNTRHEALGLRQKSEASPVHPSSLRPWAFHLGPDQRRAFEIGGQDLIQRVAASGAGGRSKLTQADAV